MDNPHGHPCPSIFVSDLFYLYVYSHGKIGVFQFHIIIPISTSYNRKMRYYPTALRCG